MLLLNAFKKFCLYLVMCFCVSCLLSSLVFAYDVSPRIKDIARMKQEVIQGSIPVFCGVYGDDKDRTIENKIESLLLSALRKKDNVRIVGNRKDAWLYIEALFLGFDNPRSNARAAVISFVYGSDTAAGVGINPFNVDEEYTLNSLLSKSILEQHVMNFCTSEHFKNFIDSIVDDFDVNCIEPNRRLRDWYLQKLNEKKYRTIDIHIEP